MFYIKVKNLELRTKLIKWLSSHEIVSVFHYIPLHSSVAGVKFGRFNGKDEFTTKDSERLLRLPLFYNISEIEIKVITDRIKEFFYDNSGAKR